MTFIVLLVIMGVAAGLEVGPVHIVGNSRYISYRLGPSANNSVLECPIQLSQGETLQEVTWVLWDGQQQAGTYRWFPNDQGIATGLLEGVVNLSKEDEKLELTNLRYDLGGFYSCSATLTDGQVQEGDKWEALVIDTTSNHYFSGNGINPNCAVLETIKAPAIFPAPTVHAGIYSKEEGVYSEEATDLEWHKVIYSNKSTAYSLVDRLWKLDEHTAPNSELRFTLGVTKTNGDVISLSEIKIAITGVDDGCVLPRLGPHQMIHQHTGSKNCIGRLTSSSDIQASVTCEKGYHAESTVHIVRMQCSMNSFIWTIEDELDLEDLQCAAVHGDHGGGGMMVSPAAMVLGTSLLLVSFTVK